VKIKLCLIEQKKYTAKLTGEDKIKLIFVSEKGQYFAGYGSPDELLPEVSTMQKVDDYDPERAHELEVDRDLFDDKLSYRVRIAF